MLTSTKDPVTHQPVTYNDLWGKAWDDANPGAHSGVSIALAVLLFAALLAPAAAPFTGSSRWMTRSRLLPWSNRPTRTRRACS